jgi:hypothetical protein
VRGVAPRLRMGWTAADIELLAPSCVPLMHSDCDSSERFTSWRILFLLSQAFFGAFGAELVTGS